MGNLIAVEMLLCEVNVVKNWFLSSIFSFNVGLGAILTYFGFCNLSFLSLYLVQISPNL